MMICAVHRDDVMDVAEFHGEAAVLVEREGDAIGGRAEEYSAVDDGVAFVGVMNLHAAGEGEFFQCLFYVHGLPAVLGGSPCDFFTLAERNSCCRVAIEIPIADGFFDDVPVEKVIDIRCDGAAQREEDVPSFPNSELLAPCRLHPETLTLAETKRAGGMEAPARHGGRILPYGEYVHLLRFLAMEIHKSEELSLERKGPCATIRKGEGVHSFLYGVHVLADNPEHLPLDADGLVFETGETRWDRNPVREIAYFKSSPINRQFRNIIPNAERRHIPLYFLDPVWAQTRRRLLADLALIGGEAVVGLNVFRRNDEKKEAKGDIDEIRRAAREALGAWLWTPFVASVGRLASALTGTGHHFTAETLKCSHRFHPEQGMFLATLRNIIIAEKLEWLMRQSEQGRHLCTVMGALHADIERFVQHFTSEERMRRLALYRPLLRGAIPATFTDIVECRFDGKEWQESARCTVPQLQELLKQM